MTTFHADLPRTREIYQTRTPEFRLLFVFVIPCFLPLYKEIDHGSAFGQRPFHDGMEELKQPYSQVFGVSDLTQGERKAIATFLVKDLSYTADQLYALNEGYREVGELAHVFDAIKLKTQQARLSTTNYNMSTEWGIYGIKDDTRGTRTYRDVDHYANWDIQATIIVHMVEKPRLLVVIPQGEKGLPHMPTCSSLSKLKKGVEIRQLPYGGAEDLQLWLDMLASTARRCC